MKVATYGTIHQLTFGPRVFPINCFLVEGEDELTLIDTGLAFCAKGILNQVKKLAKPLTHIVITHAHSDHVGAVHDLKSSLPECKICISQRDYALVRGNTTLQPGEASVPIKDEFDEKSRFEADILLTDGDVLNGLQVILCPGHTPGSIALYEPQNKVMIVGDVFVNRGELRLACDMFPLFPFPAWATWDGATMVEQSQKLLGYDIKILAVGHGKMVHEPAVQMKEAIERMKGKLDATK